MKSRLSGALSSRWVFLHAVVHLSYSRYCEQEGLQEQEKREETLWRRIYRKKRAYRPEPD